jgi:formylglycine-generating enzyme required for sulfatase activity
LNNSNNGGSTYSTQPVGQKTANALHLSDMSGNVRQWCFDWNPGYSCNPGYYSAARVCRGGIWLSVAYYLQLGYVSGGSPFYAYYDYFGFRPVRTE